MTEFTTQTYPVLPLRDIVVFPHMVVPLFVGREKSVRALEAAWKMTRRGGLTVTAGLPPPDAALAVNVVSLVGEERTLKGSYIGTCVPSRDIPRYVALYRQGRLPVDRLMSGTIPLEDINAGFDRLHAGEVVRLVVTF